jgi:hypothetical protein
VLPLPKAPKGVSETIVVRGQAGLPRTEPDPPDPTPAPAVVVSNELVGAHPAVRWLETALKGAKPDPHGRLVVGPSYAPEVRVCKAAAPRALRLLDALAKALEARGHRLVAQPRTPEHTAMELMVFVGDEDTTVTIEEKLGRNPHVLTAEERSRKAKWGFSNFPKYDNFASGELTFRMSRAHYKYTGRKSWSDEKLEALRRMTCTRRWSAIVAKCEFKTI